jgi:predicted transcriptional regulator
MKKYEKTVEEIAKELSITPNRIWKYLSAKEVVDDSRLRSEVVKDYTTFQMIHTMPKKDWKDAVEYVIKNDTSRADFDKKIDTADMVEQKLEFVVGVILQ